MTFAIYKDLLAELRIGKRLPTAVYFHTVCLPLLPESIRAVVEKTADALGLALASELVTVPEPRFNLLKFHTTAFKLSYLRYPDFTKDPHLP